MRLKKFENFEPLEDEMVVDQESEQGETLEHGFYWVEFNGKMTVAEWVHDPDGSDFWLPAGEQFNPSEEEINVLQYIEPPVGDEIDDNNLVPEEPVDLDDPGLPVDPHRDGIV